MRITKTGGQETKQGMWLPYFAHMCRAICFPCTHESQAHGQGSSGNECRRATSGFQNELSVHGRGNHLQKAWCKQTEAALPKSTGLVQLCSPFALEARLSRAFVTCTLAKIQWRIPLHNVFIYSTSNEDFFIIVCTIEVFYSQERNL